MKDAQDRGESVDTVKKTKASASKKKIKHKITMHIYHDRPEITLIKHFLNVGEWKKVHKVDDAEFTYVYNERKLDWDISLRTMVEVDSSRSTKCLELVFLQERENSGMY